MCTWQETETENTNVLFGFLLRLLIQAGYDLDVQDHDGWTPLHAAAHWGVKEACSILAEALCDMDIRNKLVSQPGLRMGSKTVPGLQLRLRVCERPGSLAGDMGHTSLWLWGCSLSPVSTQRGLLGK